LWIYRCADKSGHVSPRVDPKLLESQIELSLIDASAVVLVEEAKHLLDQGLVKCWKVPLVVKTLRRVCDQSDYVRLLEMRISAGAVLRNLFSTFEYNQSRCLPGLCKVQVHP
jgi:hypothetical protein